MNFNPIIKEQSSLYNQPESFFQKVIFENFTKEFQKKTNEIRSRVHQNTVALTPYRKYIFSEDLNEIKRDKPENFINALINLLAMFCLSPDKELLDRFRDLGCSRGTLKWLIPQEQILLEIERVNCSDDIRIDPHFSLELIQHHFTLKITNSVLLDHNMVGKKRSGGIYNNLHNSLFDYYKRKSYSEKNEKKLSNEVDKELNKVFNHPDFIDLDPQNLNSEVLSSAQGKTEKNTLGLMFQGCVHWSCSERHLYIELFDFFKMLMPDIILLSEKEFVDDKNSGRYDGNYDTYKFKTLKKILTSSSTKQLF